MKNKHLYIALAVAAGLALVAIGYLVYNDYRRRQKSARPPALGPAATEAPDVHDAADTDPLTRPVTAPVVAPIMAPGMPVVEAPRSGPVTSPKKQSAGGGLAVETPPIIVTGGQLSGVGAVEQPEQEVITPITPRPIFPLGPGSQGTQVAQLQTYLLAEYGVQFPEGITADFDGPTAAAVRKHLRRDKVSETLFHKTGMGRRRPGLN